MFELEQWSRSHKSSSMGETFLVIGIKQFLLQSKCNPYQRVLGKPRLLWASFWKFVSQNLWKLFDPTHAIRGQTYIITGHTYIMILCIHSLCLEWSSIHLYLYFNFNWYCSLSFYVFQQWNADPDLLTHSCYDQMSKIKQILEHCMWRNYTKLNFQYVASYKG